LIIRAQGGDYQTRDMFTGTDAIPRPSDFGSYLSSSGQRVTVDAAVGIPAAMAAIRLLSETIGVLPMRVAKLENGVKRFQPDAKQVPILETPNEYQSAFDFWAYIVASLNGWGNAYILKGKPKTGVADLIPLEPDKIKPKVDGGKITYEYWEKPGGTPKKLTRAELIHVPGILVDSRFIGSSPIAIHRNALGNSIALSEFAGRFFRNDATPGGVITTPQSSMTPQQVQALREGWNAKHQGSKSAHSVGFLWGGATYEQIGINLRDAQFIDGQQFGIGESARIFKIFPRKMIDQQLGEDVTENDRRWFYEASIMPWLRRIESAFHADNDLFPNKSIFPSFDASELLRPDLKTLLEAAHQARQAGVATANEFGRPELGLPPHPDGDVLQQIPVGGGGPLPNEPKSEEPRSQTINVDARTHVEPTEITLPDTHVDARTHVEAAEPANVHVDVPVHVDAPEIDIPDVNVDARTHVEPPNVEVNVKGQKVERKVLRDGKGRLSKIVEEPAE
jgi:HK97 family phage portal protein